MKLALLSLLSRTQKPKKQTAFKIAATNRGMKCMYYLHPETQIIFQDMMETVKKNFVERYHAEPLVVRSPGRVNIIGEHTDYNEGFVLPGAINKYIYIAVSKRNDELIDLYAGDFKEEFQCSIENIG